MSTRRTSGRANATQDRRSQLGTERDRGGTILKATTISFTNPGTIADSGNGLALFIVGQRVEIRGSARNSRVFTVVTSSAASLTVLPAIVTTEGAGPLITITTPE